MHRASYFGNYEAVFFCLNFTDLKIYSLDYEDNTPLHFAAKNFHIECLRLMLKHKRFEEKSLSYLFYENKHGKTVINMIVESIDILVKSKNSFLKKNITDGEIIAYIYNRSVPEWLENLIAKNYEKA